MHEPSPGDPWIQALAEPLNRLDDLLQHLPDLPGGAMRQRLRTFINDLRELTIDARGPRLLIIGRPRAGKSSLGQALFGDLVGPSGWLAAKDQPAHGTWYTQILPGVGLVELCELTIDGPTLQHPDSGTWTTAVTEMINGAGADAVLYVQPIEEWALGPTDCQTLECLWADHPRWPSLFVLANRIDTVNPPGWAPPYDFAEPGHPKAVAIAERTREIAAGFRRQAQIVYPVGTYWDLSHGQTLDYRYNLAPLQDGLYEAMPLRARLVYARAARHTQGRLADLVIEEAALLTFALGLNPLPLADALPISIVQGIQVTLIMAFAGRTPDWPTAVQFINRLGLTGIAAMTGREFFRNLAKLVPGAGDVVSAGMATATTIALGETAKQVFTGQTSEKEGVRTFDVLRRAWEKRLRLVRSEADLAGMFRQPNGNGARTVTVET